MTAFKQNKPDFETVVAVWVPGRVPTKNRVGFQGGRSFNPCAQWERDAGARAIAVINAMGFRIPVFPHQPVEFKMVVFVDDVTKYPHGKTGRMMADKPGDNPNYYKAPCDALKRVMYADDKQIRYTAGALIVRSALAGDSWRHIINAGSGSNIYTWPGSGVLVNVRMVDVRQPFAVFPIAADPIEPTLDPAHLEPIRTDSIPWVPVPK